MSNPRASVKESWRAWPLALILLLLCATGAPAQNGIQVNSADPDTTEQGTYDLEVVVGGDNFPSDPEVDFFVTGTQDPGGITVKKVKRQGPKNLKVTLDVDEAAQTELKFDIEVRSRSNGRSGKGTELFAVQQKSNGPDVTPPGPVLGLQEVLGLETYRSVTLQWIAPADDGHDPASGPVASCGVVWRLPGEQQWKSGSCINIHRYPLPSDWGSPGETIVCETKSMSSSGPLQGTGYIFGVSCRDDEEPNANIGELVEIPGTLGLFSEFRDDSWGIQEVPISLSIPHSGAAAGHGFDLAGEPLIIGEAAGVVRIVRGSWNGTDPDNPWDWTYEDLAEYADSWALDPLGQPAFARMEIVSRKQDELSYTYWDGGAWITEPVATFSRIDTGAASLAFDPISDEPILGYCAWSNRQGGGLYAARRSSGGSWTTELIDPVRCVHEGNPFNERKYLTGMSFGLDEQGNPAVVYGVLVDEEDLRADIIKTALWDGNSWIPETVATEWVAGTFGLELQYDQTLGDFVVSFPSGGDFTDLCERQAGGWNCNSVLVTPSAAPWLAIDSSGEVYLVSAGDAVILSRRDPATSLWSQEHVDFYQEHPWWNGSEGAAHHARLVLAPPTANPLISESPTLSWTWDQASESHLYFAWKEMP